MMFRSNKIGTWFLGQDKKILHFFDRTLSYSTRLITVYK